jgi:hypothetical protein
MLNQVIRKSDDQLNQELFLQLGLGPMRFGPVCQEECLAQDMAENQSLSEENLFGSANIKVSWETNYEKEAKRKRFTDETVKILSEGNTRQFGC